MSGRKLGRGLDVLIAREVASPESGRAEVLEIPPSQVRPNPQQPRKRFSIHELEMLKASIAKEGILQPILVRKADEGYELVAGERRLRAALDLGLEKIPALLVTVPDDRLLEVALIENIQRENLNPIELGTAYRQLIELRKCTQETLAEAIGLSRPLVANTLRLLELPEDMQGALVRGHITMGHAKVLLSVIEPREQRLLFEKIAEEKLSVRDLEAIKESPRPGALAPGGEGAPGPTGALAAGGTAASGGGGAAAGSRKASARGKDPVVASLEERFRERLGTRVRIREKGGRGNLRIDFYSTEDFERIRDIIIGT